MEPSRKLCLLLVMRIAVANTLAMPATANAEEIETDFDLSTQTSIDARNDVDEPEDFTSQTLDEEIRIDLTDYITEEEIFLEPNASDADKMPPEISGRSGVVGENTERARVLNQKIANPSTPQQSRNPFNFSDEIPLAGDYIDYGPYQVASGEMIEAKMKAPEKTPTQYLLSISYWNGQQWALIGYSMIGTGGGVCCESVGKINTLPSTVYFNSFRGCADEW